MGLFSRVAKESLSYEVPGYLLTKEIKKWERQMFSGTEASYKNRWLLGFAAPMLAKDGQFADGYPRYTGKKIEKMEKAFRENWGAPNENTVEEQLSKMLMGSCATLLDPLYHVTREYPKEKWDSQIYRLARFSERQTAKIGDMENVYRKILAYGMPLPAGSLIAYDLCRAGNLICIAVGLEALRPANAPDYLEQVAWVANQYYTGWKEYYAAYAIGRAFWLWKMEQFLAMNSTTDCNCCYLLLKSPLSFLSSVDFKSGVEACRAPDSYYHLKEEEL